MTLAVAAFGVLLFHVVSVASGKVTFGGGLGWDGQGYARMVTGTLADGTMSEQTRPLLILVARIPYALGLDVITSFHLLNYLYAFVLYLTLDRLMQRQGAAASTRAVLVGNVALCIATSKMFAYYPVQVDLGALALTTLAFHLVATDRKWAGGIACVFAAASREFGVAPALYGIVRMLRRGRPWHEAARVYLPSIATVVIIRAWVAATNVGDTYQTAPLSVGDAIANLALWLSPAFAVTFVYFAITVFGGISALLIVRPRWCLARLREAPELAIFLLVVGGASAAGNLDIWRYLVFALPVAIVFIAQYCAGCGAEERYRVLGVMTLLTVLTQRPLEPMDTASYFRDWFPLYHYFGARPPVEGLLNIWATRVASLLLALTALSLFLQRQWRGAR